MDFFYTKPDPATNVTVTKNEFLLFHNIDRKLFSRLVVELDRETSQSTHVMAFIMWLEKTVKNLKIVKTLLRWPITDLGNLADEAILVLNFIECAEIPSLVVNHNPFPLIQTITGREFTLEYFHYYRMEIISAVTKILNDVCAKAFTDIVQQVQHAKAMKYQGYPAANGYGANPYNPYYTQQVVYYAPTPSPAAAPVPTPSPAAASPAPAPAAPAPGVTFVPQQFAVTVPQWNLFGHYG